MRTSKISEPTWIPELIDGDDEGGWVIIFQNSVTGELRDSSYVFDTEEEALQCFENGGDMPVACNKIVEDLFGKAPKYH